MTATVLRRRPDGLCEYRLAADQPGRVLAVEGRMLDARGYPYDDEWYPINDAELLNLSRTDVLDELRDAAGLAGWGSFC